MTLRVPQHSSWWDRLAACLFRVPQHSEPVVSSWVGRASSPANPPPPSPRSFATVLVLWAVALASLILISLQSTAWRQASAGRETLARARAKWAARAGVEAAIARLAEASQDPTRDNSANLTYELQSVAAGRLLGASYAVWHVHDGAEVDGPADAHAKLNINRLSANDLLTFIEISEDVADAILDWIDEDDDPRPLGAEAGYYQRARAFRYAPRNGPMRSLQELELVAGVSSDLLRGEDWNLNGILDPNENDGDESWPPDNADGRLDPGLSEYLTAASIDGGLARSGQERLDLRSAQESEIASRLNLLDRDQAAAIAAYAAGPSATIEELLRRDPGALARAAGASAPATQARALSREQLVQLFDEALLENATLPPPSGGKLNINTCSAKVLEHLTGIDPALADAIILERSFRSNGFESIIDLLDVPSITRGRLAQLSRLITVRSNAFIVTCRGRDDLSGIEVEITATLDRSALPVTISDYILR